EGKARAMAGREGVIVWWDVEKGRVVRALPAEQTPSGPRRSWRSLAYSRDGRLLAAGAADGSISLWDDRGRERSLRGHLRHVVDLAFSADGRRLASAGWDEVVKVWDVTTGLELLTLRGHDGFVHGVAFSADGGTLASIDGEGVLRLW